MSESKRQLKFAQLIRKEISEILQRDFVGRFPGSLVTVSDVSMSPDLGLARIYFSIFPVAGSEKVMQMLNAEKSKIRGALGRRIGKEVRIIPELAFFDDQTAEEASRMDKLLDSLDIPPESPEDSEEEQDWTHPAL